jgi:hypothetical protein
MTWTIWERRWTLFAPTLRAKVSERTMTSWLLCTVIGLFLMTPLSEDSIGWALHAVTGQWNLDDYFGHTLIIGAAGDFGINVGCRLHMPIEHVLESFRRNFLMPYTVIVPVMLFLFVHSPNADRRQPDMMAAPTDWWLDFYWTLLAGFLIYIFRGTMIGLFYLRRDPRNRHTATIYIAACAAGIFGCTVRIATTWLDINCADCMWWVSCVGGATIAYAAAASWRAKVRWLAGEKRKTGELL